MQAGEGCRRWYRDIMIRLLTRADEAAVAGLNRPCWSDCRIKAVWKAYGPEGGFARFYANGDASLVLGLEGGTAILSCRTEAARKEAEEFLPLVAREALAEVPLALPEWTEERGGTYTRSPFPGELLPGAEEGIQTAYELLSGVFPDSVNPVNYRDWYADLSHRVRHGMSRVFTLPGVVSGTAYCLENGLLTVAQLGVASSERGKGWGRRMLAHLCAGCSPADGLILLSQDGQSDGFYEHLGFSRSAGWYYYGQAE